MIKVSVMYPNTAGARFDHAYYRDKHMPLLKARMGDSCLYYTVDKGFAGGEPGSAATRKRLDLRRSPSFHHTAAKPETGTPAWVPQRRSALQAPPREDRRDGPSRP